MVGVGNGGSAGSILHTTTTITPAHGTVYEEGLYVDYRYFDSFNKPAAFLFGHGLSICFLKIMEKDHTQTLTIMTADRLLGPYTMVKTKYRPIEYECRRF